MSKQKKTKSEEPSDAREYIKSFVISYVQENIEELKKIRSIDDGIISEIQTERYILDWILQEHLAEGDFKKIGITIKSYVCDDTCVDIYKIKDKYIQSKYTVAGFETSEAHYTFVKPVKKKVTVIEYVPCEGK